MLSARGVRNVCPRCTFSSSFSLTRFHNSGASFVRPKAVLRSPAAQSNRNRAITQAFSTSRCLRQEAEAAPAPRASPEEIERVVRDAKQRFRDTLPKGYLNDEEYALYERLYGPPLRETAPEDVGIDTHADMGSEPPRPDNEGVILKQLEGGEFEEIAYTIPTGEAEGEPLDSAAELELEAAALDTMAGQAPGYVESVARNQREYDAMQKLARDFEETQKKQREEDDRVAAEEEEAQESAEGVEPYWPPEEDMMALEEREPGEAKRFHPLSLAGRFHGSPVEIALPRDELITPIRALLERTHLDHVKSAAETAFGGPGLPTSPSTPEGRKNGHMGGVGLAADQKHMTEIEADAFLASFVPPAYASIMAALREVRKREGSDWLQSKLKNGGLSVLDAGSGGAGLLAWEQVVQAEWDLLKEQGDIHIDANELPGKKTVVVGSDRLRYRMKNLLHNTTFLPRLPDYEHSGEMRGGHLDAPATPQPRKKYDVIIASHLFLQEKVDHYRQAILNNLWSLLNPDGGVLIVLEKAHPRGFEAVAHVRDTLLKQFLLPQAGEPDLMAEDANPAFNREREQGHIIAPCTNHKTCPMYQTEGKSPGRKDYCYFNQRFVRPAFYTRMLGNSRNIQGDVEFSYVAFRRGVPRTSSHTSGKEATEAAFEGYQQSETKPDMLSLPRAVLPPLKRKGHVTLDLCTAEGKLERWTVPKSYSKQAYHDARKSRWGDLWPLGAKTRVQRHARVGKGVEGGDGGKRAEQAQGKKRKVEIVMGFDGVTAREKNAPQERRAKNKRGKNRDLLQEIIDAEEAEEREIGDEIDAELEGEMRDEEGRKQR